MFFFYRKATLASKLSVGLKPGSLLHIEFTAAHKEMASRIGADEAAFLVAQPEATDWTKLPPVFPLCLFWCGRFGSIHRRISSVWQTYQFNQGGFDLPCLRVIESNP
jgi:hypothetical protein